jgi:uncharacterized membrane protein
VLVVTTDQFLYYALTAASPATELSFLATNAVSGVAYYVLFDTAWREATVEPAADKDQVSITKAVVYRVFDTARVLGVSLAVGTPLAGSLALTAASATVRTIVYIVHDYAWSYVGGQP